MYKKSYIEGDYEPMALKLYEITGPSKKSNFVSKQELVGKKMTFWLNISIMFDIEASLCIVSNLLNFQKNVFIYNALFGF